MNLVIAGCSRRKLVTPCPVPAMELYQGGCIPALRSRLGAGGGFRNRVRILSARYGMVAADEPLLPYDQPLSFERAQELRPSVMAGLERDFEHGGRPEEVLLLLEPLYLVSLADLLSTPGRPRLTWVPDPTGGWAEAAAVLDRWGW